MTHTFLSKRFFTFALMKIHRVLIVGLHQALVDTFFEDKYADKALEKLFKANKKWGSRDRGFVAESFYDIVRWQRKLMFFVGEELSPKNIYDLIAAYFIQNNITIPDFEEFKNINVKQIKERFKLPLDNKAVEHSVPDWLYALIEKNYPKQVDEILQALNEQAAVYVRVNTLKTNAKALIKAFKEENIKAELVEDNATTLVVHERKNLFRTEAFQKGWFEVQDLSSQQVADALQVEPGMRVIDACAGGGGKALHLAALMQNKGQIIALDIYDWKLKELKRRAKRAGAHNIETRHIESSKTIKRLKDGADALLIDAPCSGLGVLKRNPDAKWKLNLDFIERVKKEQADILDRYSQMLRKGGKMVYATCSILPEENEQQIAAFLENHKEFTLVKQETLLPNLTGNDGFFIAQLKRNQ
ncbi:MAG: methyltransferase domain-containing protein [Chitinophagales bacterium]|nr:methyltransferase domain-containing protein [Chitinophagales bacterium]